MAVFRVAAIGATPFSYQWSRNGSPITGATTAALTLANVQLGDAGSYTVRVSNGNGSATSSAATLTVLEGYGAAVYHDHPAAYYPMNETGGTVAYDYYSGACNGSYMGSPTLGVAGPFPGTAVNFNDGPYVDLGNPAALNSSGQITVEAWINPSSLNGYIIAHSADANWNELWLRFDGNGNYNFGTWTSGGAYVSVPVPAGTLNNWVHLVGTYDGANWNLYQNGTLLGSQAGTAGAIQIGCDWGIASGTGYTYNRYFTGSMNQVAIYRPCIVPRADSKSLYPGWRNVVHHPNPTTQPGPAVGEQHLEHYHHRPRDRLGTFRRH